MPHQTLITAFQGPGGLPRDKTKLTSKMCIPEIQTVSSPSLGSRWPRKIPDELGVLSLVPWLFTLWKKIQLTGKDGFLPPFRPLPVKELCFQGCRGRLSIITRSDAGDPAAVHRAELAGENCVSVDAGSVCRECLRYLCAYACDMCQMRWVKMMVPKDVSNWMRWPWLCLEKGSFMK